MGNRIFALTASKTGYFKSLEGFVDFNQ